MDVEYTFSYSIDVLSSQKINFVSAPLGSKSVKTTRGYTISQEQSNKIPKREIRFFYTSENMFLPQLKYQKSPDGEVACMASFVPTFVNV